MSTKSYALVLALALAFAVSACGDTGSPTAPNPVPPGTPASGTINIVYPRPAGMTCLSAGTPYAAVCDVPVRVGYGKTTNLDAYVNLDMVATGGAFTASGTAPTTPPPAQLEIAVVDPWLCPPAPVCNGAFTGRGISVNGTRLKDGLEKTYFSFIPPTVYP